jgi:serpin B
MNALMAVGVVAMLMGCAGRATETPTPTPPIPTPPKTVEARGPGELVRADLARVQSPDVEEDDLETRVAGNNALAFDLYRAVRKEGENIFYSPYSIGLTLAMAYAGARGQTEQKMAQTLRYELPQERLHPAFNALEQRLGTRDRVTEEEAAEPRFRLIVANAVWGQSGYSFLEAYLEVLASNYGTGMRLLDFGASPEEARQAINAWVRDRTTGLIEDLIPEGVINTMTRLVLTNAVYFRAPWKHPFDDADSTDGAFHLLGDEEVTALMMEQTEQFDYVDGDGYEAVELPYVGDEVSMVVIAPDREQFDAFETSLDADRVGEIVGNLERTNMTLRMPTFEFASDFQLSEMLQAMGMTTAFSQEEADFSGIDGTRQLFIRDVLHKGFVSVDETGTEAAAATAVVIERESLPPAPIEVTIDRPFVFLIHDVETGTILFVGRVLDPTS